MLRALTLAAAFGLAAAVRLHGAASAPPLSGFDGPYHAANIGILFFEGRLPLGHEGWSTFHPPFYYALCAGIWKLLPDRSAPETVLFSMRLVNVISGLGLGVAIHACGRMLAPARPWLAVVAAMLAWFIPMHLGPSFLLGNEIAAAALGAVSVWLLLRCLEAPASIPRAIALGLVLGLGLLTKFNVLIVAAVSVVALLLAARRREVSPLHALTPALSAIAAIVLVSGWYYAGNLARYGQPVLMQNEIVTEQMRRQGYGAPRDLAAYLDPGPGILLDPVVRPRDTSAAVWPTTFASVWFDPHASVIDPRAPWARRIAPLLFAGGALWTSCALVGAVALARRRERFAVPLAAAALGLLALGTLAGYAAFSWRVATVSALKGTYLSAGLPAFALLAALGAERLARRSTLATAGVAAALAVSTLATSALYWTGGLAPLRFQPALAYRLVYTDAPTERVLSIFVPEAARDTPGKR